MWVGLSKVPIPLFSVDVPMSSKRVWFGPKVPRAETNDQIKLGEELRPASLAMCQDFRGGKIFVVHDNINQKAGAFQVVSPVAEQLEDSQ